MRIENVTDNIVVMLAPKELEIEENSAPTTAIVTCIALPDELVFVDTGVFVDVVKEFRAKMEKKFNRKTTRLFLTHDDWDHIFAMEAFKDVTIVATKAAIEDLDYNLRVHAGRAYVTSVSIDKYGKSMEVPQLLLETEII